MEERRPYRQDGVVASHAKAAMSAGPVSAPDPVVLDIPGDWWDSFLYSGRLYLINIDGDVLEVDWPRLVKSIPTRPQDRLAMELSFIDARLLYGREWERFVRDDEIRDLLTAKINRIGATPFEIEPDQLQACAVGWHRGALPEALTDLDVFRSRFYTASADGVDAISRHRLDAGRERQWDGEAIRLRASQGIMALAAGRDGLRQANLPSGGLRLEEPWPVLEGTFTGCSWLSSSIYGTSHANAGALAVFTQQTREAEALSRQRVRTFEAAVDDELLFDGSRRKRLDDLVQPLSADETPNLGLHDSEEPAGRVAFQSRFATTPRITSEGRGFSWAGQGLICRATPGQVELVSYKATSASLLSKRVKDLRSLTFNAQGQEVVDGDVAPFGVVVETEDDLVVISNDGARSIGVRPVRWRTYHRATNYPNQLHVIGEDRVRVVSFLNEDVRHYARRRTVPLGRTRLA